MFMMLQSQKQSYMFFLLLFFEHSLLFIAEDIIISKLNHPWSMQIAFLFIISLRVLLLRIRSSVSCAGDMKLELVGVATMITCHWVPEPSSLFQVQAILPYHTCQYAVLLPSLPEYYYMISSKYIFLINDFIKIYIHVVLLTSPNKHPFTK